MSDDIQQPTDAPPQPQNSRSGCTSGGCFTGCLIVFGFLLVLAICVGVGSYFWVSNRIVDYTSESPVELPTVEYTPEQLAKLETRLEAFKVAIDGGEPPTEEMVLTAEEINALINKQADLRGKVFVKISEGQVSGDVSIPFDAIPGGKGRYFNGSASFDVSMENGVLIVILSSAEVNGELVPQKIIDILATENLAKDLYKDRKNAEIMRRIDRLTVEDDKIILKLRQVESTTEKSDAESTDQDQPTSEEATDRSQEAA